MGIGSVAGVALLLLIAFVPGLAFRRFYFTGPFSKQYAKSRLDSLLVAAFIPGLLLQLCGRATSAFAGTRWFYEFLSERLFLAPHLAESVAASDFTHPVRNVVVQQIILTILGGLLGSLARAIVRTQKLDLKFKIFRFENLWQYILRGEMYEFPEISKGTSVDNLPDPASTEGVELDILVDGPGEPTLYKGELVDYHLSEGSTIKYLMLANVSRRSLAQDPEELGKSVEATTSTRSRRFYNIPGDVMIFKGVQILNINVRFVRLQESNDAISAYYGDLGNR